MLLNNIRLLDLSLCSGRFPFKWEAVVKHDLHLSDDHEKNNC